MDMIDNGIASARGLWEFLVIVTQGSPIGLWAMGGALTLPALLGPYLYKYIPPSDKFPMRRQLIIDVTMIVSGVLFAWLPWQTLNGFLVGLFGGLGSSAFWRLCNTIVYPLWIWLLRRLGVADVEVRP